MDSHNQIDLESAQSSSSWPTHREDQADTDGSRESLLPASLETLKFCSLLPSLKVALIDSTSGILDPGAYLLDNVADGSGAEGDAFKFIPFK
jgi:hypothetical protein